MTPRIIFTAGARFGRWTVVGEPLRRGRHVLVPCLCECGTQRAVYVFMLANGGSSSCGCKRTEDFIRRATKHGHNRDSGRTREYQAWAGAVRRVSANSGRYFHYYSSRGITMCEEWRKDFMAFLRDMGECPKGLTLERVNNDGPYAPDNCKWATQSEQLRNTRRSRKNRGHHVAS